MNKEKIVATLRQINRRNTDPRSISFVSYKDYTPVVELIEEIYDPWIDVKKELPPESGFYIVTIQIKPLSTAAIRVSMYSASSLKRGSFRELGVTAWKRKNIPYQRGV